MISVNFMLKNQPQQAPRDNESKRKKPRSIEYLLNAKGCKKRSKTVPSGR